ncbi:MAG: ABC transporter substrate-binding protein [Rhodoglobus sp.]
MKSNLKRAAAAVVIGVTAVALVTGCAPGQVESDEPMPVETFDPAAAAGQTLTYMYFTDGPDEAATRSLVAEFEKKYDVTVDLEILPYADLITSTLNRLSAGNAPDVARLTGLGDFSGDLLPLDGYLGDDYRDQFLDGPITGALSADDDMIAVPSDLTLNAPFINVDLFTQAGVAIPEKWTWKELISAGEEVKAKTGVEYAFAMDKSGHRLSTILSEYGTYLVDGDGAALDPAKAEKALDPIVTMMQDGAMPADFWLGSGSRYKGANEIFLAGQTPIYLSGNWQVGQFVKNATFDWAVAPNPCAAECGGFPGGKYMAAFKDSKNPALAAEFVRFMNEKENQATFVAAAGALPTRVDLAEGDIAYDPKAQEAMAQFLKDLAVTPAEGFAANGSPVFAGAATQLVEVVSAAVAGQTPLSEGLPALRTTIEELAEEQSK